MRILIAILDAGGAGCDARGVYFPEVDAALTMLLERELVCKMKGVPSDWEKGGGWFTLTNYSRSLVKLGFRASKPVKLINFSRKGANEIDDYTALELIQFLSEAGWKDCIAKKKSTVCFMTCH